MALILDTLSYSEKLAKGGIPKKQAEAHAKAIATIIDEQLATKRDLKELETSLKRDMKEMELRGTLKLTTRFGAMIAVAVAIIGLFIKYLK